MNSVENLENLELAEEGTCLDAQVIEQPCVHWLARSLADRFFTSICVVCGA